MRRTTNVRCAVAVMLACMLTAAATSPGRAGFKSPPLGEYLFRADSLSVTSVAADSLIDSLWVPNGHVMTRLVLRSATTAGVQGIELGFVTTAPQAGDTSDVKQWTFVRGDVGGAPGDHDLGRTFEFFTGAEKVYLRMTTTHGKWQFEGYSAETRRDARVAWSDPLGAHSPKVQYGTSANSIFQVHHVETDHPGNLWLRVFEGGEGEEINILVSRTYTGAYQCPVQPKTSNSMLPTIIAANYSVPRSATKTSVVLTASTSTPKTPPITLYYSGMGRTYTPENAAFSLVYGWIEPADQVGVGGGSCP